MSKDQTTIVLRYPDKDLPREFLKRVLEGVNAAGYAVQMMKDGQPTLTTDRMDRAPTLEEAEELLDGYKSNRILMAFSKLEKVEEHFLQPYDYIVDGSPDTAMAFTLEGDFLNMVEAGLTPEAVFSKNVIIPNLNRFRKHSSGDLADFMAELKDPTVTDMLMARIGERGVLCFLPPAGDHHWIGKDKFGSSFPWGQVSNTHGYVEVPAAAPATEVKKGWWGKAKGPTLPVAEDKKPEAAPPSPPPELPPEKQPDTKINPPAATPAPLPTEPPQGEWKRVPAMSNNDRKKFIQRVTGNKQLPENWKSPDFTYFEVKYPLPARNLPELKEKLEQQQTQQPKDMRDPNGPRPAPSRGSEVVHEANVMVLTAEEKDVAETAVLKMMDRQGKEIPNPIDLQKMEAKYPKFSGNFGIKFEDTKAWLPEDVAAFSKDNGKAFLHLFLETRGALREAEAALQAVGDKHTGTKPVASGEPAMIPEKVAASGGSSWGSWGKKK